MKTRKLKGLTRVTVLAAALASTLTAARAAIVYVDPPDVTVPATLNGGYIDFVTGQVGTNSFTGYDLNPYRQSAATGIAFYSPTGSGVVGVTGSGPSALAAGTPISPLSTFLTGAQPAPAFRVDGTEILGVEFVNTTTGATNYGWAEFTTTAATGFPAKLTRYAYEDTGLPILAGATGGAVAPEPSTWATLGLGVFGAGIVALRRRIRLA